MSVLKPKIIGGESIVSSKIRLGAMITEVPVVRSLDRRPTRFVSSHRRECGKAEQADQALGGHKGGSVSPGDGYCVRTCQVHSQNRSTRTPGYGFLARRLRASSPGA